MLWGNMNEPWTLQIPGKYQGQNSSEMTVSGPLGSGVSCCELLLEIPIHTMV